MAEGLQSVGPIEAAEVNISDTDSGYDDRSLSTASIATSVYAFTKENGRTYHSYKPDKSYTLPNDEAEQERMDIHYHAFRLVFSNRTHVAPLQNPTSAIDIGTGTGIWAIDFADEYPGCDTIGVDLSPIQPGYVPNNCRFQVMDLEDPWDMPARFDYVHARDMNGYIRDWPTFLQESYESLKPGGWFECQDFDMDIRSDDNTLPTDSQTLKWQTHWLDGAIKAGLNPRFLPHEFEKKLESAGFINITTVPFKMPVGPWPKDKNLNQAGLFALAGLLEGLTGVSLRIFTSQLGWTVEELEVFLAKVKAELKNKRIHMYFPCYTTFGQKPPSSA